MRSSQTGYHHGRTPDHKAINGAIARKKGLDLAMRTFAIFLLLFALAALVSGLLTYPVWAVLQSFFDVPIHRVMNRIGMLILAIATVVFLRNRGLADKTTLGYALPRPVFVSQMLKGFAAGVLLMLPLVFVLFALDLRVPSGKFAASDAQWLFVAEVLLEGLATGLAVAFIEETFCRGALFTVIERESGRLLAILLPTLLYAATHFMDGKLRLPADQVTYMSGLVVTAKLFERFAAPMELLDSFLALCALGVLLSAIRIRTGAIAGCIGLHAGGVMVIVAIRNTTKVNAEAPYAWLVGSYDGVIGWMAAAWIAVVTLVYWRIGRRRTAESSALTQRL